MIKTAFALSLALSTLRVLPALGAEQFQCPLPSNPNNPAKLEQIKGLLPDVNTMTNIEQLSATIATLRRDGMSKSLIIDHSVGADVACGPRSTAHRSRENRPCPRLHRSGYEIGL